MSEGNKTETPTRSKFGNLPPPGTLGPGIYWKKQETKLVAQECVRIFGGSVTKFTKKHFHQGQLVLPPDRHKKQFAPNKIAELRQLIAEIPAPQDPHESTAGVHNGAYDTIVPGQQQDAAHPQPSLVPAHAEMIRPLTSLPRSRALASGDVCEQLVAILCDINLKSLALKGFTGAQMEEAIVNRIDVMRLRNLTIQANNSLTYFEQLLRLAERGIS